MIDYKSKRNWTKLIEDEDDNDVKFTMEFVDIMNRKEASNLKESVFLQDYKQRNYGLQPIVRAIIADKNPIDRLQPLVFDHRLTKLKNSRELTALSKQHAWFVFRYLFKSDSYDDCMEAFFVKQKDSMDLYSFNSIMLAMLHSDDRVGFYLQEKFISELDFSKAETLLMIAHCRKIDLNSLLATSKAKFHHEFTEDISLSSAEFESLYPLLFIDGLSDSYKDPMLHASLPLIKADPTKALQLFRFLEMEDDLKESLIKSMQENLDESLSIALAATRTELSQNMIADLFHLYNYNNNLVNPFLASLHESTLKNEEIVIFLMEAFENVDNEEQRQYIFEQIAVRNTVEDLTSYIEGSLENASWTIRRVFIRYIGSHPSISFRKIWQRLLKDEDRDVRAAAGQAGPALLKIIYPDKNIYCFTRTENDEDEMLKENMELIRSEVQQPDLYKDYLSVKFVMQEINVSTDKKKSALPPGPGLTNKEIQDLLLHLAVDFVEESTERVVLRVQETESSEVLNWLLEKGSYTFCTVDKV